MSSERGALKDGCRAAFQMPMRGAGVGPAGGQLKGSGTGEWRGRLGTGGGSLEPRSSGQRNDKVGFIL